MEGIRENSTKSSTLGGFKICTPENVRILPETLVFEISRMSGGYVFLFNYDAMLINFWFLLH